MPKSFDAHVDRYEEELERGLSVSGEGRDFFARGRVAHLARRLHELAFEVGSVLDFGCGTGETCLLLLKLLGAQRAVGADASDRSLEVARARHGGDPVEFVPVEALSERGDFDLVYSNGTFHHIPPDERMRVVHRIHGCLRPGGVFAFFENNPWNPGTRFVMSRIPFDRDAIAVSPVAAKRLLRSAGFEVVRSDFLFFFPRALRWLRALEGKLASLPFGAQYLVLGRR